jgi:hypothetical protein
MRAAQSSATRARHDGVRGKQGAGLDRNASVIQDHVLTTRFVLAIILAFAAVLPAQAAGTAAEMDAVLKRQEQTVEKNRQKLDQSIRANESDRKRRMERAQRRVERDAASSPAPRGR